MRLQQLTAMMGAMAAGLRGSGKTAMFRPTAFKSKWNPWPTPNYRDTQYRTDHQHNGERARRRRQRNAQ